MSWGCRAICIRLRAPARGGIRSFSQVRPKEAHDPQPPVCCGGGVPSRCSPEEIPTAIEGMDDGDGAAVHVWRIPDVVPGIGIDDMLEREWVPVSRQPAHCHLTEFGRRPHAIVSSREHEQRPSDLFNRDGRVMHGVVVSHRAQEGVGQRDWRRLRVRWGNHGGGEVWRCGAVLCPRGAGLLAVRVETTPTKAAGRQRDYCGRLSAFSCERQRKFPAARSAENANAMTRSTTAFNKERKCAGDRVDAYVRQSSGQAIERKICERQ